MYLQSITTQTGKTYTEGQVTNGNKVAYIYQEGNLTTVRYTGTGMEYDLFLNSQLTEQH